MTEFATLPVDIVNEPRQTAGQTNPREKLHA